MFRGFLEAAQSSSDPITIEHHILCSDKTALQMTGWLSTTENEFGEQEFIFIYMCTGDSTEKDENSLAHSYFYALKSAYNIIFELNLDLQTVECIHGRETSEIGALSDVRMTIDSAKNFWLNNYVFDEDRVSFKEFLDRITAPAADWTDPSSAILAEFRICWIDNIIHKFLGVAVLLDPSTVLLCCRDITSSKYSSLSTQEAIALNKLDYWINYSVSQNQPALGVMLIEDVDHKLSLIYVSEGMRSFMNLGQNDYLHYISGEFPIEQFLEVASIPKTTLTTLLMEHSASWTAYSDEPARACALTATCEVHESDSKRLYEILICTAPYNTVEIPEPEKLPAPEKTSTDPEKPSTDSEKASTAPAAQDPPEKTSSHAKKRIFARTFGHFDLFVDGISVNFSSSKEKELMALLIDRNGGTLTTSEAISYLWEDESVNDRVSAKYRKLAMGLKNTLTRYGVEYIIINNHGTRSINKSAIKCDYYELLAGNEKYREAFHNAYMTDYSWAEETLATLWDYS
jgi:hypothetical protein